jgi:O-antigen ligase
MKSERKPQSKAKRGSQTFTSDRINPLAIAILAIPFVALTPNFFIIPALSYLGNATQEVAVAWVATGILALSIVVLLRRPSTVSVDRYSLHLLIPLAAFLGWTIVTVIWTPDPAEAVRLMTIWISFAIYFGVALLQLDRRTAWWLLFACGSVILILTLSQFVEYWMFSGEMLGVFFNHGITSELLALLLPLQLTVYLTTRKNWLAILTFVTAGGGGAAMLLTLRRGALLGLGVATIIVLLALLRGWLRVADRWRLIVAGVAIVMLVGGLLTFKREELVARIRGATELQKAETGRTSELGLTSRSVKWITAWEMAKRNPILGVGNGGFPADYGHYRRFFAENPSYAKIAAVAETEDYDEIRSPHAHSEFLQIFAELGFVGLLLFCLFWAAVLRALWKARKGDASEFTIGALAGVIAFGISAAISGLALRYSPGTMMLACVAGLGCALAKPAEKATQSSAASTSSGFAIPKGAAVVALGLLALVMAGFAIRSGAVLNSQKSQSQIDFLFNEESPALNESLLRRYQQVLSYDESNSGAHLGMGFLLYQMKRPADAIPHIEFAQSHCYGRPFGYVLLAFAYEQTGNLKKSEELLLDCVRSYPRSVVGRAALAQILELQGKPDEAAKQRAIVEAQDSRMARSWELALKLKEPQATAEARRKDLVGPGNLEPQLARTLVQARARHYLN